MRRGLFLLLVLAALIVPQARAAEGYSINNGATQQITEHGVCRKVTNAIAGGIGLYVPTKFNTEWSVGSNAFLSNVISGVTLAACLEAASLRFKGNAYLTRLPATGNSQIFTWSGWVKRSGGFGTAQDLFSAYYSTAYFTIFSIDAGDKLQYYNLVASAGRAWVASKGVLRDPSAWYHIVLSVNATTGWGRVYINGVDQTDTLNPVANVTSSINNPSTNHFIGVRGNGTGYFNGYMSDVYFVDGQALTASDFGETDPDTNQWFPKAYTGTYGTNGFHLTFANPASLGSDSSGGGKNWTPTSFSTTPGTTYDPMTDYANGTMGGAYGTLNPLDNYGGVTLSAGNLTYSVPSGGQVRGTMATPPNTGKWYWEFTNATTVAPFTPIGFGISTVEGAINNNTTALRKAAFAYLNTQSTSFGNYVLNGANQLIPSFCVWTVAVGGALQVAYDAATGKLWLGVNNTWCSNAGGTNGDPATGANPTFTLATGDAMTPFLVNVGGAYTGSLNMGQRAFSYTPPSGFQALNTANLPAPPIVTPTTYFKTLTYTGNGGYLSIGTPPKLLGAANISASLRFRSVSGAFMYRTAGAPTNGTRFTISTWIKRVNPSGLADLAASGTGATNQFALRLNASGSLLAFYWPSSYAMCKETAQLLRDPSVWYHIVMAYDSNLGTAADRVKLFVNGQRITSFSAATCGNIDPGSAAITTWNANGYVNGINRSGIPTYFYGDAYYADYYNIDGQALEATSFGQFNSAGVWVPKAYTGTYGANGFHLEFKDKSNTTAATLGADTSGNGNNWTPSGLSVAAGATDDVLRDAPADYADGNGDHANFATWNPLFVGSGEILSNGNLTTQTANANGFTRGTIGFTSGKWYWEVTLVSGGNHCVGVVNGAAAQSTSFLGANADTWGYYNDGSKNNSGGAGSGAYGSGTTNGDVIGVAVDMDTGKIWWARNGSWQASGNPASGTNFAYSNLAGTIYPAFSDGGSAVTAQGAANFGQRPFAYTPPAGFKALNTYNISNTDFVPDLVWIKGRSGATAHALYDSARGVTLDKTVGSAAETAEANGLLGFNAGGFNVGSLAKLNTSGATYVAWMWKKGALPGFDVVTYTGNGGTQSISHGLGVTPEMIMVMARNSGSYNVNAWHVGLGKANYIHPDLTVAEQTAANLWNSGSRNSTSFDVTSGVNANGITYTAYVFRGVPGFSKFGKYTGNGSADGPFVYTGFAPAFVMCKRTDSTSDWAMLDDTRNTYNPTNANLYANLANAENTTGQVVDILANGFKVRTATGCNVSGGSYIYAAFAEQPFNYANAR